MLFNDNGLRKNPRKKKVVSHKKEKNEQKQPVMSGLAVAMATA